MKHKLHLLSRKSLHGLSLLALLLTAVSARGAEYNLWVVGVQVTDENCTNITGQTNDYGVPSVTFDPASSTLTLTEASIESMSANAVLSGLPVLNVHLTKGEWGYYNNISYGADFFAFKAADSNCKLVFTTSTDDDVRLSVTLDMSGMANAIDGFTSVEYKNGLICFENNYESGYNCTVKTLSKPSHEGGIDDNGVAIIWLYQYDSEEGITLKYSIDYADESKADVTEQTVEMNDEVGTTPIEMDAPGMLTAWEECQGMKGPELKMVYYGFAENEVTVKYFGTPKTLEFPALVPTPPEDAGVMFSIEASSNEDVLTVDNDDVTGSVVNVVGVGQAELEVWIMNDYNLNNEPTVEVLNETAPLLLTVNVVEGESYPLVVGGIQVNEENRKSLLDGTVQFDGKSKLVLDNANVPGIKSSIGDLEIYLIGSNTITAAEGADANAAIESWAQESEVLTILTDESDPGSLVMQGVTSALGGTFVDVLLKAPLQIQSPEGVEPSALTPLSSMAVNNVTIGASLSLLVDKDHQDVDITYNNDPGNLTNVIINDVLYTLYDTQTPGAADDGWAAGEVVLNTIMTEEEVAEALNLVPGSTAYAEKFKGLTFMVPAGTGIITVTAHTEPGHALHVKVGDGQPFVISTDGEVQTTEVPYACTEASYVRIYHVIAALSAAGSHRIGPKPTVSTGVSGIGVSALVIDTPPDPSMDYHRLMKDAIHYPAGMRGSIIVNAIEATDLDDDVFEDLVENVSNARGHAPSTGYDITYIDLRETSITGRDFSREWGAFKGLPLNTVVYLPAGNTSDAPNMVIGSVCEDMQLFADGKTLDIATDFKAAKLTFDTSLAPNQKHPICLPFALPEPEKYGTFFECDGLAKGVMQMTKTSVVSANKPYFLHTNDDGLQRIAEMGVDVKAGGAEAGILVGTYELIQWLENQTSVYAYSNSTKKFERMKKNSTVLPFSAYLELSNADASIPVQWEGEPTAIEAIREVRETVAGWYTLDGRKLLEKPSEKGVYLNNGRKIIVR